MRRRQSARRRRPPPFAYFARAAHRLTRSGLAHVDGNSDVLRRLNDGVGLAFEREYRIQHGAPAGGLVGYALSQVAVERFGYGARAVTLAAISSVRRLASAGSSASTKSTDSDPDTAP